VQPLGGAEGQRRRQLDAPQAGDQLDLGLVEPALAAHRDDSRHPAQRRELEGGREVVDVAELPARGGVAHDQQPRRLEVPGEHAVHARADDGRRPEHRDLQAGVAARRLGGQPLDLEPVGEQATIRHGTQRRVLGQRQLVVGQRAVDHRRRAQHYPAYAGRGRRGEHRLGPPDVQLSLHPAVATQLGVQRQVDHGVDLGEAGRQRRVPDVEHPPGDSLGLPAVVVEADDLPDLRVGHQPCRDRRTQPGRRAGHGDHRLAAAWAAP
jgi:hypothetical protein